MNSISLYFEKFRDLTIPDETVRTAFVRAFKEIVGEDIPIGDTRVKEGVLYADISAGAKSEMIIYKRALMARIYALCDPKELADIK